MKVKPKSNHEETRLEHHHFLAILEIGFKKIFEMPMMFVFTHYLCNVDLVLICILVLRAPKSSQNIVQHLILQITSSVENGGIKTKKQN